MSAVKMYVHKSYKRKCSERIHITICLYLYINCVSAYVKTALPDTKPAAIQKVMRDKFGGVSHYAKNAQVSGSHTECFRNNYKSNTSRVEHP